MWTSISTGLILIERELGRLEGNVLWYSRDIWMLIEWIFFVTLLLLCLSKIIFLNHYSFPNLQISRQLLSNIIFDKWIHFLKNISTIFFIEYIWKLIRELLSYYFFVHLKSWWIKNNFSFDLLFSNVTFPNLELQISRRLF